jgi:hypothetical protein
MFPLFAPRKAASALAAVAATVLVLGTAIVPFTTATAAVPTAATTR